MDGWSRCIAPEVLSFGDAIMVEVGRLMVVGVGVVVVVDL